MKKRTTPNEKKVPALACETKKKIDKLTEKNISNKK